MGYAHVHVVFLLLLAALVDGQCDASAKKIIEGSGEITSPNRASGGEYNKSADCSWEFKPHADGKDYALMLTVKSLKLYVVKGSKMHCLGSYNLTLNQTPLKCDRYVHGPISGTTAIPPNYYCNAYYISPTYANVSKIQGCEIQQETTYPVSVSYFSDGRTDPDAASTPMYFWISYEFLECPEAPTTATTITSKPVTTEKASEPATYAPTSEPATNETTTVAISDKATTQSTINPPTHAQETEETTLPTTQTSMNSAAVTKKTDVTTTTGDGGNFDQQQDMIIIIAAAGGGGGLIAIVSVVLIVVMCKRKRKVTITEPGNHGEVAMEEVNHYNDGGATENGTRASQHGGPTIPTAELYATVSEPGKAPQQAIGTASTEAGSESTQPIAELYATVSKPPRLTEAKTQQLQDEPVIAPNQPESCLYATVSKLPRVTEQPQPSQPQDGPVTAPNQPDACLYASVSKPPRVIEEAQSSQSQDDHVTAPDQSEGCLYAAVSIKKKGGKETIHYQKDMVHNVLYGTSEDYK